MSKAIARQRVEYSNSKNEIAEGKIKLYKNKLVIITENKMKIRIQFTHSMAIFLNHQSTGFHIQHADSCRFTIVTGENARQWVKLINFYLVRDLTRRRHAHPLKMLEYGQGTCKACSTVIHNRVDQRSFTCELCANHDILCYECYRRVDSMLSRSVRSDSHKHVLYRFDEPPAKKLSEKFFNCSKCNNVCGEEDQFNRTTFHCLDCLGYVECAQCFKALNTCGDESLGLKHFSELLHVDESKQEISMKPDLMLPANISLITEGYWDLSQISLKPADNAYFEVEFLSFNSDAVVGIGIGNEIFTSHALLGNQQNSFAYYNNGEIRKNVRVERNAIEFHQGDTVGCGILLDNYSQRQVFFTLNGKILDQRLAVHDGMNCYPGICFTKESLVHVKTNFKGPFKFDLKSVPDYRNDFANYFELLPDEVMELFLQCMARTPLAVFAQLQLVCKTWRDLLSDNNLWRDAFVHRWRYQNPRTKIRDWKQFYRKRKQALNEAKQKPSHPIENCEFDFQCPLIWQSLQGARTEGVAHCNVCNKDVYGVKDKATLQTYVQMGRCVVFSPVPWKLPTIDNQPGWTGGRIMFPTWDNELDDEDWTDEWLD